MVRLAWRNLVQNRTRLVISTGGVGLALTLVLFFDAVFAGATDRLTVYIDHAEADVWVSQEGVRAMHMSSSALPATVTEAVRDVPGVVEAMPLLYATDMVHAGGSEYIAYVFGLPDDATMGRPWEIVDGTAGVGPGEIIIDRSIASSAGVGVGDSVGVLGQELRVAGLTAGTSTLVSSVAFVPMADFARVRGQGEVISFVLVRVAAGESPGEVAARIAATVSGVTVQTSEQFAQQERELSQDMSADLLSIMNGAGFLTGFAVVALTVYIATIARRREYGVLKAMGVRNRLLYGVVVLQALIAVAIGFAVGAGLTLLLAEVIPRLDETLVLSVDSASLGRAAIISIILAGIAALLPAWQLAHLEPVAIMRRG